MTVPSITIVQDDQATFKDPSEITAQLNENSSEDVTVPSITIVQDDQAIFSVLSSNKSISSNDVCSQNDRSDIFLV